MRLVLKTASLRHRVIEDSHSRVATEGRACAAQHLQRELLQCGTGLEQVAHLLQSFSILVTSSKQQFRKTTSNQYLNSQNPSHQLSSPSCDTCPNPTRHRFRIVVIRISIHHSFPFLIGGGVTLSIPHLPHLLLPTSRHHSFSPATPSSLTVLPKHNGHNEWHWCQAANENGMDRGHWSRSEA